MPHKQGYKDIGQILANAREERRLSVVEVAEALHIRPRYIEALEDGKLDALPGYPYVTGYLKRYVVYLRLDKVEILRRFELVSERKGTSRLFLPHRFSLENKVPHGVVGLAWIAMLLLFLIWAWWVRMDQTPPSLVDEVPEIQAPKAVSAMLPEKGFTCMLPQKRVYPPCYWPKPIPQPSIMMQLQP